jgi:hypothetical protein
MKPAEDLDERLRAIRESPTYRLAYEDIELLGQDELRPLRLQLELLKPERILHEQGIRSTVVVFGSARVSDAETAEARLGVLERQARVTPEDVGLRQELAGQSPGRTGTSLRASEAFLGPYFGAFPAAKPP